MYPNTPQQKTILPKATNMLKIPRDCVAKILSLLADPGEVCRLSVVSPQFNLAAQSDAVWEKFLPSDYQSLISASSCPSLLAHLRSKKQLYLSLCDYPILIDDRKTSFSLEKSSGKKVYLISARSLRIVWGDTPRYWQWNSDPDSRFHESAELRAVCWLEIRGRIKARRLSAATAYGVYLVYALKQHGFRHLPPLEAAVGVLDGGEIGRRECSFGEGREREDGWLEIELGEFFNGDDEDDELEASLMEIDSARWKTGIVVEGIEFRPKK